MCREHILIWWRRCLAVAIVGAFSVSPMWAQGEAAVRGQVVATANASLLAGVTITITPNPAGEPLQTTTDAEGRFSFQGLRPGEHRLATAHASFSLRELRFTLEPREIRIVALSLDLRGLETSVQVTGEAALLTSGHSPSSTLLTTARLETLPLSQRANLSDAVVTLAPGMIRGHDDFVHIRGHEIALNPSINGVSFWENPHAVFSSGLSPEVIDTANVMTGGFSAEYGNRFGGVLDIVTKSGLVMRNSGSVTLNGGQSGRRHLSGEYGGRWGQLGYYAFASASKTDHFLSPPDAIVIHNHGGIGRAFGQVDRNFGHHGSVRVVVAGDRSDFEIPRTPIDLEMRPLAETDQRTRQRTAIASWTGALADMAVSASFYQRSSRSQLFPAPGPLTAIAALDRELTTIGGKVDVTRFAGRHSIKFGVDTTRLRPAEHLAYDYNGYLQFTHLVALPHIHFPATTLEFTGRRSGTQFSAYVQDGIQIGAFVTADVGIRLDRYDLVVSANHASPRANLAIQVGGGVALHASYNHFFVPPAIEGVLSSSAGLTSRIDEIGRPLSALAPTTEHQFELGVSGRGGPGQLGLTAYYRATDNPVHTTVWPDSRVYSYASFDRERAYGLEAKAEWPGLARYGVTGYVNYALGRVTFFNPVTGGFVTEADHITQANAFLAPMDQTHTLTAGLTYVHRQTGLWVGTATEYGSGTPIGHGGPGHEHAPGTAEHVDPVSAGTAARVPGHITANLSVGVNLFSEGKRRSRLSFQFDVENVTNNVYAIAREGEFSPGQFATPRLMSVTARVRF